MDKKLLAIVAIVCVIVVTIVAINSTGIFLPDDDEINGVPADPDDEQNGIPDEPDDDPNGVPNGEFSPVDSLQFSLKETMEYESEEDTTTEVVEVTLSAKDIDTETQKIMAEGTVNGEKLGFIVNSELDKGWILNDEEWTQVPDEEWESFASYYEGLFYSYYNLLATTDYQDYTEMEPDGGPEIKIYEIQKNPTLDDSMFVAG